MTSPLLQHFEPQATLLWGLVGSVAPPLGSGAASTVALPAPPPVGRDTSDTLPSGGYLLPNMPPGWLPRPSVAQQYLGALDGGLDAVRVAMNATHDAHTVTTATGGDLDDLVALVGLTRLAGETDNQLRMRAPATVQHGISASAGPDMATYLRAATGLPATVADWPSSTPGFDATVVGNNGLLTSIPDLIRDRKVLGTPFRAYAVVGSQADGGLGLGEFGLGEAGLGSADARVFLGS